MSATPAAERTPLWRMSGIQILLESGALLNSIAFFAAMPFASLYLSDHTRLSKPAIGAVVGSICLIAACGGLAGGAMVDRVGATRLMRVGLLLDLIVYALLAIVRSPAAIVPLILMLGPARLMVDPAGKKLLSQAMAREARAFRVRYMTLCAGAIAGPALGGVLYHVSPSAFFAVPALFYGAYLVLVTARCRRLDELDTRPEGGAGTRGSLTAALRDRRLLAVVGAGMVIFVVFSQLESMIPLYMKSHYGSHAQSYFAVLFITNAVLALAFQVPIDRVLGKTQQDCPDRPGLRGLRPVVRVFLRPARPASCSSSWGSRSGPSARAYCCRCPTWRSTSCPALTRRACTSDFPTSGRPVSSARFSAGFCGHQRGGVFRGDELTDIPLRADALPQFRRPRIRSGEGASGLLRAGCFTYLSPSPTP